MARRLRYVYPGLPHHVIQRGNNRQNIFVDDEDRQYYLENLKIYGEMFDVKLASFCLMTNHVHLLIYPADREGAIKFLKQIHQKYSQFFNWKNKRSGKLWENRYKMQIGEAESAWTFARYIERNPLRAGMVAKAEDYPYSSANAHLNGVQSLYLSYDLLKDQRNDYLLFFADHDLDALLRIRDTINQQKAYGSNEFIKSLETKFDACFGLRSIGRPQLVK